MPKPRLIISLLILMTLLVTVWMAWMGRALNNEVAVQGIVSFELAGSAQAAQAILDSWDERTRGIAMLIQGVDYLYLLLYSTCLASVASILTGDGRLQVIGRFVVVGPLVAAPLDAVENYALIMQLLDGADDNLAKLARYTALPKFLLVGCALVFIPIAAVSRLFSRANAPG